MGDSLRFQIQNVGSSDQDGPSNFVITEDDVLLFQGTSDLDFGEDTSFVYFPNGSTMRLEADQSPFHPGSSFPSVAVEGCGINLNGGISLGYVTQYAEDDNDPFVSILCQESYDNYTTESLVAFPKGYGMLHLIPGKTELEYLVRFQNNSPDTVYQVQIFDTPFSLPRSCRFATGRG